MPTENRRVATYLPKELDDRLKAFIVERNLKGDSPALIVILSEYFGIDTQVAQKVDYSGFVRTEQFQELVSKVSELTERVEKSNSVGGLLGRLPDKMRQIAERLEKVESFTALTPFVKPEPTSELPDTVPGQMDLLGLSKPVKTSSDSLNSLDGELKLEESVHLLSEPLSSTELAHRFGVHEKLPVNKRTVLKDDQKFAEWTRGQDPDGIAWKYDSSVKGRKKFVPINAVNSDQVNPISPSGSERSEEG